MASRSSDVRPKIKLRSTAGTGYTYISMKNRRNTPDRIVLSKYDPVVRRQLAASAVPLSADDVRGALALMTVVARHLARRALGVED